ncbi:PREDICTED: uncharacterized protein C1orf53 homolog isoform X2 [Chinchilla lanigera]|uniref:uncharacterized protein C1orf53 homolog isoform X2 n=1 Tax=Chinchilla lanigera TaxID=34839 RepID=UPI00038EA2CE|nr:PREDICTED: uncharacterized protein C1orf53 homolog isoform X2 [Chinchilla lanigera]
MAAGRIRALAGAALHGRAPSAQLPRPLRVAMGSRQQQGLTLGGASEGGRGGSTPGPQDAPQSLGRRPASEGLTAAERRILELHETACAVRLPRAPATTAARCAPARPASSTMWTQLLVSWSSPGWPT